MDTFKIKAILTAVEKKSLSKAAEEYSYTPSAFSHMLTAFEEDLGVKVFLRNSTGVALTEEGEKLVAKFQNILNAEEELYRLVSSFEKKNSHNLTIALYASISDKILPNVLKKCKADYPSIKIDVNVVDSLGGWLENDRADIVICDKKYGGDVISVPLIEDEYVVLGTHEILNGVKEMTIDELYNYPFVLVDGNVIKEHLDVSRFKNLTNFNSEDNMSVFKIVKSGFGVTLFPEYALNEGAKGLVVARLKTPIKRVISYSYKKSKANMFALKKFIKLL